MDKFEQKQNFPNVFGAIGVTHIAIKAPKSIQKLMSVKKCFSQLLIILQGLQRGP